MLAAAIDGVVFDVFLLALPGTLSGLKNSFDQCHLDLSVQLGRLTLPNPILVASGTFGYAREMAGFVDLKRLGAIIPKTITQAPAARQCTLANDRNRRRHAQLDRPGQRRARSVHRAPFAVSCRRRCADHRQHRRPRLATNSSKWRRA